MDRVLKVAFEGKWYEFLTRTEGGYDVAATDEIVVREIFVENVYQVGQGDLADTGIVLDIGGNVGAFAVYCAALGARHIHTFEPDSLNWEVLQANIAANSLEKVIHPHKVGVSRAGGSASLIQGQGASFVEGTRELTSEAAKRLATPDTPREAIETVSLASAFADSRITNCDVLKIDCEGSEYSIIEGADSDVLAKARFITLEFHTTDEVTFGRMVAKLTLTHNLHIIGKYTGGGQIYARLY
jgi:FkbM family methyltransferase